MKKVYKFCVAILLIAIVFISIFYIYKKEENSKIAYRGICGENVEWLLNKEGTLIIRRTSIFSRKCKVYDYCHYDDREENPAPWDNLLSYIKKIEIKEGITEIGNYSFYNNQKCNEIILPDSLEIIGDGSFMDCGVEHITLPENLKVIGEKAFSGCSNLQEITIPPKVTEWGYCSFNAAGIRTLNISEGIEKIGSMAFCSCTDLEKVVLPSTLKNLGNDTFSGCEKLKEIKIPEKVKGIPELCFSGCFNLEKVELPKNLEFIGSGAFDRCNSLKELKLPNDKVIIKGDGLPKNINVTK